MHITAYISQSNLKDVVQNITQIIDVIIGKTPCILLLVTALCQCRRCQYISFWEQVFCPCLSFQSHSGRTQMLGMLNNTLNVTAGEGQLAEVFVQLEHCGQAISLVRSARLAPLLLISGSMQRFADRECFGFFHMQRFTAVGCWAPGRVTAQAYLYPCWTTLTLPRPEDSTE